MMVGRGGSELVDFVCKRSRTDKKEWIVTGN